MLTDLEIHFEVTFCRNNEVDMSIIIAHYVDRKFNGSTSKFFYQWEDLEELKQKLNDLFSLIRKGDFDAIQDWKYI